MTYIFIQKTLLLINKYFKNIIKRRKPNDVSLGLLAINQLVCSARKPLR